MDLTYLVRLEKRAASSLLLAIFSLAISLSTSRAAELIQPKVLVIATYEMGKDQGDIPGELQYWVEREKLDQAITVPGLDHPLLTNGKGLYAMISGTTSRCAVQMMTLALDPRFDLRQTYFLLSGIAGADPAAVSIASVVWVRMVVDGDPAFEIDSRQIPAEWPYGIIALGATEPGKVPANVDSVPSAGVSDDGSGGVGKVVYKMNPSLTEWAYQLTKNVVLPDNKDLAAHRAKFKDFPKAQGAPNVIEGESLGADRFWHGSAMNHWAQDWVRLYTKGAGTLVMSDCEDQGICLALHRLDQLGRVDFKRLLVLRSASNYTLPAPGVTIEHDLFNTDIGEAVGYLPSLDNNYRVGSVVVAALLQDWSKYQTQIP